MARLRYNGLATTLGAALTDSDTTITFAAALTHSGGTAVPTITGSDYIPLTILDGSGAVSEIVSLTAYATGATTGTITRAQESTTAVAHASGDVVTHSFTVQDVTDIAGATESGTFIGAHVTRLANAVVANEAPLTFDTENADTHGYWTSGNPTKFTIPTGLGGWYMVGANVTTLGTDYSGPANDNVQIAVLKNWDGTSTQLGYYCAYERFNNKNSVNAHGNSLAQPVYLNDGDVLQVVLIGPTSGGLLVESNPSDGAPSGYLTDTGPGTLSPHFYLVKLGPGAPGPQGIPGDPGVVQSIVPGANVTVDNTDPANPVVSASATGGGASSDLLGFKEHATSAFYSTTSGTDADVDATNLAVTFTAPASGKVLVELTGLLEVTSSSPGQWSIRSGASTVQSCLVGTGYRYASARFYVTGLTPGNSYTYKWGHSRIGVNGAINLYTGGNAGTSGNAMMRVLSMP